MKRPRLVCTRCIAIDYAPSWRALLLRVCSHCGTRTLVRMSSAVARRLFRGER